MHTLHYQPTLGSWRDWSGKPIIEKLVKVDYGYFRNGVADDWNEKLLKASKPPERPNKKSRKSG